MKSELRPMGAVEATVTSKGQITLPKVLRDHLGIRTGTRIRFQLDAEGGVQVEPVRHELEDLWAVADKGLRVTGVMTFEEMDAAKARRSW